MCPLLYILLKLWICLSVCLSDSSRPFKIIGSDWWKIWARVTADRPNTFSFWGESLLLSIVLCVNWIVRKPSIATSFSFPHLKTRPRIVYKHFAGHQHCPCLYIIKMYRYTFKWKLCCMSTCSPRVFRGKFRLKYIVGEAIKVELLSVNWFRFYTISLVTIISLLPVHRKNVVNSKTSVKWSPRMTLQPTRTVRIQPLS